MLWGIRTAARSKFSGFAAYLGLLAGTSDCYFKLGFLRYSTVASQRCNRVKSSGHMLDKHMRIQHIVCVIEIIGTTEFEEWFMELSDSDTDAVARVVDMLAEMGIALPFPYSSAITGSNLALRELRIQSQGHPLRVFYIFDFKRQAVLLIGGDKTGDDRFYERFIPEAERIYAKYLREE